MHADNLMIMFQVLKQQNYLQSLLNASFAEIPVLSMSHFSTKGIKVDPKKTIAVKSLPSLLFQIDIQCFWV